MKYLTNIIILCTILLTSCKVSTSYKVDEWLSKDTNTRTSLESQTFANKPLSNDQAAQIADMLVADKQAKMLKAFEAQWDNRELTYKDFKMPFYYNTFGEEPANGRSLFISLHGGGQTTPEMNDQQYDNQKHLYDATIDSLEGIYLAPRAPTNTWNLWHQDHIDHFFNNIIQMAVIKLNVNPNKVYLLGYSAGGDGVYQMAPRMADRWAAASMMAGHPNGVSPLNLRNTPFAIHMGALDSAYNRNQVAQQWGNELKALQNNDHTAYIHDVQIHKEMGHWMKLKDAVALPWMKNYQRNPLPKKVVWKKDSQLHNSFYWIGIPPNDTKNEEQIIAEYNRERNEINIIENSAAHVQFFINDDMLNLDLPVSIKYQGKEIHKKKLDRSVVNIYESLKIKGDAQLSFSAVISIVDNKTILE